MLKFKFLSSVLCLVVCVSSGGDASLTSNAERPCPDDIVVFTCEVSGIDLFWRVFTSDNILVAQFSIDFNSEVNRPENSMLGFTATLQSRTPSGDSTSTLTTTASAQIDGYTVVCSDVTGMVVVRKTIQLADQPSPPTIIDVPTIQESSTESAIVAIKWNTPFNNGTADVNYTVNISPSTQLSANVVTSTTVNVTVDYNVNYTLSIVATNCAGSSAPSVYTFSVPGCPLLTTPSDGVLDPESDTDGIFVPGATVTLLCNQGFMPTEPVSVTCMDNLMWDPDPNTFVCIPLPTTAPPILCGPPLSPSNGSVNMGNQSPPYAEGTTVTFQCDDGLFPRGTVTATCTDMLGTGEWDPNPADLTCSEIPVCQPATSSLTVGEAVGISVVLSSIVSIIIGLVVGATFTYCVMRRQVDRGNKEQTPPQQLQTTPAGPVYEEVCQPREEIELKTNQSYGPVRQ